MLHTCSSDVYLDMQPQMIQIILTYFHADSTKPNKEVSDEEISAAAASFMAGDVPAKGTTTSLNIPVFIPLIPESETQLCNKLIQ